VPADPVPPVVSRMKSRRTENVPALASNVWHNVKGTRVQVVGLPDAAPQDRICARVHVFVIPVMVPVPVRYGRAEIHAVSTVESLPMYPDAVTRIRRVPPNTVTDPDVITVVGDVDVTVAVDAPCTWNSFRTVVGTRSEPSVYPPTRAVGSYHGVYGANRAAHAARLVADIATNPACTTHPPGAAVQPASDVDDDHVSDCATLMFALRMLDALAATATVAMLMQW
jgi:hypothetical protein